MPAQPPHNAHQPILHQHAPNEVSRMQNGWRDSGHDDVCHLWNQNDQRLKTDKGGLLQTASMDFPISMETDFDLWAAQLQLSTTIKGVLDEIFYLRRRIVGDRAVTLCGSCDTTLANQLWSGIKWSCLNVWGIQSWKRPSRGFQMKILRQKEGSSQIALTVIDRRFRGAGRWPVGHRHWQDLLPDGFKRPPDRLVGESAKLFNYEFKCAACEGSSRLLTPCKQVHVVEVRG